MATVAELEKKIEALTRRLEEQQAEGVPATARGISVNGPQGLKHYRAKGKKTIELFQDDRNYKDPLYISINGRNMVIKRGVPVEVDDYVADFITEQMREERVIIRQAQEEEEEFKKLEDDIRKQS